MNIESRVSKLEKAAPSIEWPVFIVSFGKDAQQPAAYRNLGGDGVVTREPGESTEAFRQRAEAMARAAAPRGGFPVLVEAEA